MGETRGAPPLTSLRLGVMCLSERWTLEPAPIGTRIAAVSACYRISILLRALRVAPVFRSGWVAGGREDLAVVQPGRVGHAEPAVLGLLPVLCGAGGP